MNNNNHGNKDDADYYIDDKYYKGNQNDNFSEKDHYL